MRYEDPNRRIDTLPIAAEKGRATVQPITVSGDGSKVEKVNDFDIGFLNWLEAIDGTQQLPSKCDGTFAR
jgi:hypothetical protein